MKKFKIQVSENQRVLIFKNAKFSEVLLPGSHSRWQWGADYQCENYAIDNILFTKGNTERFVSENPKIAEHLLNFKLSDTQVGLLYNYDVLIGIVPPSENIYCWRCAGDIRMQYIDIEQTRQLDSQLLININRVAANGADRLLSATKTGKIKPVFECNVPKNAVGLLYINGKFHSLLETGNHGFWQFGVEYNVETYSLSQLVFKAENTLQLVAENPELEKHLEYFSTAATEVGLIYKNNVLEGIIPPRESLYCWRAAGQLRLETIDISADCQVSKNHLNNIQYTGVNDSDYLLKGFSAKAPFMPVPIREQGIEAHHCGLLFVDGKLKKELPPGSYGFWQFNHDIEIHEFDTRVQLLDISGQEILTKDKVSLRLNLTASIQIVEPILAVNCSKNVNDLIYKYLQLALREAVGTKTLDELLIDKEHVNQTVYELVFEQLNEIGVKLHLVGVKDIILPGEIRTILNQVVEAQKAAEANVIKRREETAATRSLHNTAKMMENNPILLRLKELEALEKISEKVNNLSVYGGLEGLMQGTVKIS